MNIGIPKLLQYSALAVLAGALSACDSASTDIVERDPVPVEGGHGHDHDHDHGRGRLLISGAEPFQVSVWDLDHQEVRAEYSLAGEVRQLYASPGYRYGFILQRNANLVNVVDGGQWYEDHGGHGHDRSQDPLMLNFSTDSVRPTYLTNSATQSVIFYDGDSSTETRARVGVFTEGTLANNGTGRWLDLDTHMHGTAQARGDYLLTGLRDPESESNLPDQVALYHWHDDHFDREQVFDEPCPGLHGSAQAHEFIVFGCSDGVLVIEQDHSDFTASKIGYPADYAPERGIGVLVGHPRHEVFVGVAAGHFFEVDPEAATIHPIEWTEGDASAVEYAFADNGDLFVIADDHGRLHILSVAGGWSVLAVVDVLGPAEDGDGGHVLFSNSTLRLAASGATDEVFVLDGVENRIRVVDLHSFEVTGTIALDFTPSRLTWLGIAQTTDHEHSHDEEHDDHDEHGHDDEHDHDDHGHGEEGGEA